MEKRKEILCLALTNMINEENTKKKKSPKVPSLKTLEKWFNDGYSKTPCGCKVEVDGICKHGKKSWLIILGLI